MILSKIIENKRKEVNALYSKKPLDELKKELNNSNLPVGLSLKAALLKAKPHQIGLIAEVKRSSPSKGVIREDFDPVMIAEIYQQSGANALSVLTDERFFGGKLAYIPAIKKVTSIPILRKEFIIDEYQVYESKLAGADAILLIADILEEDEAIKFIDLAHSLGMEVLMEVHTEADMLKVKNLEYDVIGINNRNLNDFKVDLEVTSRLIPHLDKEKIIVSESGIKNYNDVMYLKSLGVNGVLIGETFMKVRDIGTKVKEVMGFAH